MPFQCRISGTWAGLPAVTFVSPTAQTSFADTALMLRLAFLAVRLLGSVSTGPGGAVPVHDDRDWHGFMTVDPAA